MRKINLLQYGSKLSVKLKTFVDSKFLRDSHNFLVFTSLEDRFLPEPCHYAEIS